MIVFDEADLNPSQVVFLRSVMPNVLFAAGLGSGKSTAGIMKTLQLKGANGPLPGLVIAQTFGALFSNIVDPMLEMLKGQLPAQLIPVVRGGGNRDRLHLRFADGCKVYLGSAENPKGWDGVNVAWLYGDECRHWTEKAWHIAEARVRIPAPLNQRALTSTPALNWMDLEFNSGKAGRQVIHAGTAENLRNLSPDYIDNLKLSYSPRMQRAMLYGEFVPLYGAVFEAFDPQPTSAWFVDVPSAKDDLKRWMKDKRVYLAVDPGFRRSAYVWIAKTGAGEQTTWVVFDQLMADDTTDMTCVDIVNKRGWAIDEVWCDPAGDQVQSVEGLDTFAALRHIEPREHGRRLIRAVTTYRSIAFGVDKLRVLLGGYEGLPARVKFARRLLEQERGKQRGIVKDLAAASYPEMKDGRPITDIPLKDGVTDHSRDAIRNWAVGMWMSEPWLRSRDKDLLADKSTGYRLA